MAFHRITLLAIALPTLASAVCPCVFQGQTLPASIYDNYPNKKPANCTPAASGCTPGSVCGDTCTKWPGMYKNSPMTKYYGTNCAPWDQMPDTPWYSYCPMTSDWSNQDFNWCQQPWCYVDNTTCTEGVPSSVFAGSEVAYYSYLSCGHTADCYTNIAWNASYVWPANCPYDPTSQSTYRVHKSGVCACMFQGAQMDAATYTNYPVKNPVGCTVGGSPDCANWPGQYKDQEAIKLYGTTCASWDQMPGTPWFSYCPAGSLWCHYDWNWCTQPWCYVNETCSSGVASSVYKGSPVAFYSYDTCLSTPDCYTNVAWKNSTTRVLPAACPYDSSDNGWYTAKACASGWEFPVTTTTTTAAKKTGLTSSARVVELSAAAAMATVMAALVIHA